MAGTQRDRAGLLAIDAGTYIPDNTAGLVDPLNHRTSNEDINASTTNFLDDNFEINVDGSHEYTVDPTGSWDGTAQHDLKFIPKKWLDDAISDFLVNDAVGGNLALTGGSATGADSIAIGNSTSSASFRGVAIGTDSNGGSGLTTVVIGDSSSVTGVRGVSIGSNAISVAGVSIGIGSKTSGTGVSIGQTSGTNAGVAIGFGSSAIGGGFGVAGGNVTAGSGLAIGNSNTSGSRAIAIGDQNTANQEDCIVIGSGSSATGDNGYVISRGGKVGANGISFGFLAGSTSGTFGSDAISIGSDSNGGTNNVGAFSTSIGKNVDSTVTGAISMGYGTTGARMVNSVSNSFGFGWAESIPSFLYSKAGQWLVKSLPVFANDVDAGVGGVVSEEIYKTATGELRIKL
jgi:hypothetical protein